ELQRNVVRQSPNSVEHRSRQGSSAQRFVWTKCGKVRPSGGAFYVAAPASLSVFVSVFVSVLVSVLVSVFVMVFVRVCGYLFTCGRLAHTGRLRRGRNRRGRPQGSRRPQLVRKCHRINEGRMALH